MYSLRIDKSVLALFPYTCRLHVGSTFALCKNKSGRELGEPGRFWDMKRVSCVMNGFDKQYSCSNHSDLAA